MVEPAPPHCRGGTYTGGVFSSVSTMHTYPSWNRVVHAGQNDVHRWLEGVYVSTGIVARSFDLSEQIFLLAVSSSLSSR